MLTDNLQPEVGPPPPNSVPTPQFLPRHLSTPMTRLFPGICDRLPRPDRVSVVRAGKEPVNHSAEIEKPNPLAHCARNLVGFDITVIDPLFNQQISLNRSSNTTVA